MKTMTKMLQRKGKSGNNEIIQIIQNSQQTGEEQDGR